ncbi:MAG: UDP-2,3-diacylglucosamine diphosphatase [Pseudomonadota bacterium]
MNQPVGNKHFISDVHLTDERPESLALWQHYIRTGPQTGDQLYILGDLFDVWIGDDDDAPLAMQVRTSLQQLTQRGVTLYLQHGNRDFMLGQRFARQVGAMLLPEVYRLTVAGQLTILLHGDQLCTDDHRYQAARRRLRSRWFQWLLRWRSLDARRRIAAAYRARSRDNPTPLSQMDAVPEAVINHLQCHHATQMIHGHTHRPAVHQHTLPDGQVAQRYVLDEWHPTHASVWTDDGNSLHRQNISNPS